MPKSADKYKKNEELIKLALNGDKSAEEELLINNDKLCYHIAHKFQNTGIDREDLASMARIGLWKAYQKFDVNREIKFATYATRIMQNEILMFLRKNKKHTDNVSTSLDTIIHYDDNGGDLTLGELIAAPEEEISTDDHQTMAEVLKIFYKYAKEREIAILEKCIINNENQRVIAKELGISQSYVSRIEKTVKKKLKYIAETGKYRKIPVQTSNKKRKDGEEMPRKIRLYSANDYYYAFKYYPQIGTKALAGIMGVSSQAVTGNKKIFKQNPDMEIGPITPIFKEKLEKYSKETGKMNMPTPKKEINIDSEIKKVENENKLPIPNKIIQDIPENMKIPEISKKENIILNNKISISSNKREVAQLIYGLFELLDKTPDGSTIKLELSLEATK